MSVEIDGVIYRTERAWEKKHRHVLKRQLKKGVEREWKSPQGKCSAMFYSEAQTRPWPDAELKREKRERAEARRSKEQAAHDAEVSSRASAMRHRIDLEMCWGVDSLTKGYEFSEAATYEHTAWQWCDLGFVPIAEARWEPKYYDFGDYGSKWFYCSPWDVRWKPARAAELKESGPQTYDELPDGTPYDGRPWW